MTSHDLSDEQIHKLQNGYDDLVSNTTPIILDPSGLDEKKLLKIVGDRFPGKPCLAKVASMQSFLLF